MMTSEAQVLTSSSAAPKDPWDLSSVSSTEIEQITQSALSWSDLNWVEMLSSHWHNRLVHFPIVLIFLVLLLTRKPSNSKDKAIYQDLSSNLISGIALLSLGAVMSGQQQAGAFSTGPMSNFLFWHQLFGIMSSVLLLLAMIYINRENYSHRYLKWGVLVITACIVFTGFLGGVLASH